MTLFLFINIRIILKYIKDVKEDDVKSSFHNEIVILHRVKILILTFYPSTLYSIPFQSTKHKIKGFIN